MTTNALKQTVALLAMTLLCVTARATVETFTTAGTFQWQCPIGITTVTVECWGGGGAGGSAQASGSTSSTSTAGGGGAGGAYVIKTNISVTAGNSYTVTVGSGGTPPALPPTDGAHGDGGDSWFNNTSTVLAKGGTGGISKNAARPAQGNGGSCPSGSIGSVIYLGGSGANGNGAAGTQASGGGGGSGGTLSVGNNGGSPNVQSGATAVSGGGPGGNGKQGNTGAGSAPASGPGGGGGGGIGSSSTGSALGGAGADGKVAISYTIAGSSYTWAATSGSADWTSPSSWSPNRNSPANNDVLIFNQGGSSTAINVPNETDGKLQVSNNTAINLEASGGNTLTIGETASDSLTVASGCQLNITGTSALTIALPTGARGSISGSMIFSNATDALTAADASGITFNSGAAFTQNCSGNIFGSGTANSIIFAAGSTFIQYTGGNPFQKTQPASVVVFQPGNLFSSRGNTQPSSSGRTYANFESNETNLTTSLSGSFPLTMSNLTVLQNTLTVSMSGGFNLNGNASVASGATLNLGNTVATASGKTITVNGTLIGTATISGSAAVTISSSGTLSPGSSASIGAMTFATAPVLQGTNYLRIDRNGGTPLADEIILSSGTLNYGGTLLVTNIGAALQPGDTFTLFSAGSFGGWFNKIQLPDGYTWNTNQLLVNGSISVSPAAAPTFGNISVSGGNLVLKAINGSANGQVSVLSSTNLTLPLNQWPTLTNGNFDGSGNFTVTNGIDAGTPQQFYILQTPN